MIVRTVLIFLIAICIASFAFFNSKPIPEQQVEQRLAQPARLIIPSIGIEAPIDPVGLTPEGDMGSPTDANRVGWYAPGTRPGDIGSAVIDGHAGWKNGKPAIFDGLHKVEPGDQLIVEDDNGARILFIVQRTRTFDKDADSSLVFTSNDGKSHLNLITCAGAWDETEEISEERLVVFAERELQ